jgi:hypothetical protein
MISRLDAGGRSNITPSNAPQAISKAHEAKRSGASFLALNFCGNSLVSKGGVKFLAALLKARNLPLIKLDVSDQTRASITGRLKFGQELCSGRKGNRAMTSLNLSSNALAW